MSRGKFINGTYIKNEYEKDRLRMAGGSWSINLEDILDYSSIENVEFRTEAATYRISWERAKKHGFARTLGGEDKLVVPLEFWEVTDNDSPRKT